MLNCKNVSQASDRSKLMLAGNALIVVSAVAGLVLAPAAQSRQIDSLGNSAGIQTVLDATSSGGESEGLLLNGTPVRLDRIWTVFEGRRQELDKLLSNHIMHGKLPSEQAIAFRTELERIAESLYRFTNADTLSNERAVELAGQLESVSQRVSESLKIEPLPHLIVLDDTTGEGLLISDFFGSVVAPSQEDVRGFRAVLRDRHARLSSSITIGQSMGALPVYQADALRKELDNLSRLETRLDDTANARYADLMKLTINYDSIRGRLNQHMNGDAMQPLFKQTAVIVNDERSVGKSDAVRRRAGIEQRISLGLIKGQLNDDDAEVLRVMLDDLCSKEEAFRRNSGKLTPQQMRQIESGLDRIVGALDSAISL